VRGGGLVAIGFGGVFVANLIRTIQGIILENQTTMRRGNYWPRLMQVERIRGKATVITGIRRCGKSVYEKLYMHSLKKDGSAHPLGDEAVPFLQRHLILIRHILGYDTFLTAQVDKFVLS